MSVVDIIAVIESLIQLIPKHIAQEETVSLGDFGSFSIMLRYKGADIGNDFNDNMITTIFVLVKN